MNDMIEYLPLYVLAVPVALALALWVPRWLMLRRVGSRVPPVSDLPCAGEQDEGETLVYFYSPRCGQCRPVAEAVDHLASRGTRVVRVDVSACAQAARRFGIREIPAVVSVVHGRITRVLIGSRAARVLLASDGSLRPPPRPA